MDPHKEVFFCENSVLKGEDGRKWANRCVACDGDLTGVREKDWEPVGLDWSWRAARTELFADVFVFICSYRFSSGPDWVKRRGPMLVHIGFFENGEVGSCFFLFRKRTPSFFIACSGFNPKQIMLICSLWGRNCQERV
jgi:hypothetical protein